MLSYITCADRAEKVDTYAYYNNTPIGIHKF